MNSFCVRMKGKGIKEGGKASTPSKNSHEKGKNDLIGSKQANEINNNNKKNKADSTGNGKEGTRSIFLCEVEEEGFKEARKAQRGKMERDNQHP